MVVVHVVTLIRVFSAAPAAMMAGDCAVMPAAMHQVKERTNAGMRETCITVDPIAACPAACVAAAVESQLKGMHCLPANKMSTKTLAKKSKMRMLQDLQWKHIDAYETVQVPTACAPAA